MNRPRRIGLGLWVSLVVAAAVMLVVRAGLPGFSRELVFWSIACFAGEVLWVRLPLGSATVSMAACFNFAALLVLPPNVAIPVTALATLVAELAVMRKRPIRALFNAGQTVLAVAAARAVFDALGGGGASLLEQISSLHFAPVVSAAVAYYAINRGTVVVVVALAQGLSLRRSWCANFGCAYDLLSTGAAFSLGAMLAMHYAGIGMVGTLFVVLPLLLACDGYRRFARDAKPAKSEPDEERRAA